MTLTCAETKGLLQNVFLLFFSSSFFEASPPFQGFNILKKQCSLHVHASKNLTPQDFDSWHVASIKSETKVMSFYIQGIGGKGDNLATSADEGQEPWQAEHLDTLWTSSAQGVLLQSVMDVLRKLHLTPATVWFHPHHHFYSETHRQRQTWVPLWWNNLNFPKSTTNSSHWTTMQNINILNTTTKYFTKISGLRNFCLLGMTDTKWFAWTVTALNDHTTICLNFQLSVDLTYTTKHTQIHETTYTLSPG